MTAYYENVTDYLVDTSKIKHFNTTAIINYPVYYNKTLFHDAYESERYYMNNFFYSMAWGSGILAYWGLILLLGGLEHWFTRLFPVISMKMKGKIGRSTPIRWWRKNVSLPALFNGKHTERNFFGGIIPTRFESLVLSLFIALVVIAEAVNVHTYPYGTIWKLQKAQLTRFIGDRTGIDACFLIVLTYLFAGRNNMFLWITGWKQSTFYTFHKWIARLTVLVSFVHTITMLLNSIWIGKYESRKKTTWWRLGAVAMVAAGIMFIHSLARLRVYSYEMFLYVHIGLAVLFLAGAWKHTQDMGYGQWTYATAAIWGFDRFMRVTKIAQFGLKTAQATMISDEILVLSMPRGFRIKDPTPGSFGYVYFIKSWSWFQSHPFTVLEDEDGTQKFLIKIKNGVTKKLYNRLTHEPNHTCQIKVAVEGFYGEYKQAYSYDEVIMVSGGNGIPGVYEYVSDIAKHKKAGKSNTKLIKFYWVIRHWHSIDWFLEELKKLQEHEFVQTVVYVTKYHDGKIGAKFSGNDSASDSLDYSEKNSNVAEEGKEVSKEVVTETSSLGISQILEELPHVDFRESRPNLGQIIHEDVLEAVQDANIAVLTCAHNVMCDDVRRAVAFEAGEPRKGRIDLFELLQTW